MGRGGNEEADRLLYGKAPKLKSSERRISAATRARELANDIDSFQTVLIRNSDCSDPETDASDFLADLMHWSSHSRYGEIQLLFEVSQPFFERYRQVMSIADIGISQSSYFERVRKESLPEGERFPSKSGNAFETSEGRAGRIESEIKRSGLEADQMMALYRIWCLRLDLDYEQMAERAHSHFVEEN